MQSSTVQSLVNVNIDLSRVDAQRDVETHACAAAWDDVSPGLSELTLKPSS